MFVTNVRDGANVGIYWSVAIAATLNGPSFAENVLAQGLISSDGNLALGCGRLLSSTSQVTLIQDSVSLGWIVSREVVYEVGAEFGAEA